MLCISKAPALVLLGRRVDFGWSDIMAAFLKMPGLIRTETDNFTGSWKKNQLSFASIRESADLSPSCQLAQNQFMTHQVRRSVGLKAFFIKGGSMNDAESHPQTVPPTPESAKTTFICKGSGERQSRTFTCRHGSRTAEIQPPTYTRCRIRDRNMADNRRRWKPPDWTSGGGRHRTWLHPPGACTSTTRWWRHTQRRLNRPRCSCTVWKRHSYVRVFQSCLWKQTLRFYSGNVVENKTTHIETRIGKSHHPVISLPDIRSTHLRMTSVFK